MSGKGNNLNDKYTYMDGNYPKGCVFAPFRSDGQRTSVDHPLDNDIAGLCKVLNEIVIPACCDFTPAPECFSARIKKLLEYTISSNGFCFTFPLELLYRFVASKEQQTKENVQLIKIIRIIAEILFAGTALQDDIVDHSEERLHKKAWHTICPGGTEAAIFDASIMFNMSYYLLKRFFNESPVYVKMLEAINESMITFSIGQLIDFSERDTILLAGKNNDLRSFKTGHFTKFHATLALLHAGITDDVILKKVERIFIHIFTILQEFNDFTNYYCPATKLGKEPYDDITNGSPTWVSQTAVAHFDEEQKKTFFDCYGSSDPVKVRTIVDLYDKINITEFYITYMKEMCEICESYIEELPDKNLKKACTSIKQWVFGC